MHMADALISPMVGGAMLAATAAIATHSVKKLQLSQEDHKIPLMGVMGAFVFTVQMINFTIPGTGSSGHLGGGLLLAALLGPYAGFLTMASVLLIQALFFGDGGLLAFGCNVFNMGFFASFLALPLIFRPLLRKGLSAGRITLASILSSLAALQLGAFSVVLESLFSGKTELPFTTFLLLMQPIHLAIGLVEGLVTASILTFIWNKRPELLPSPQPNPVKISRGRLTSVLIVLVIAAVLVGGVLSGFASGLPDGLEWSIEKVTGSGELSHVSMIHGFIANLQEKTAILPDYDFKSAGEPAVDGAKPAVIQNGTSVSGLLGGALTLLLVVLSGFMVKASRLRRQKTE